MVFSLLKGSNGCLGNMGRFGLQVIQGRWFMVFASHLIMSMSGANFLFSLFSNDIKSSMGYDQATLNLIGFSKDIGCSVGGVFSGIINGLTPPWVVIMIAATVNFFGYFMIWLAVVGILKGVAVWQMCMFICIGANSLSFSNTGVLVTSVKNFPSSRGFVLGLSSGFVGLSGAILTQFYRAFLGKNSKALILLIACLPSAVFIVFLRAVRVMKLARQPNEGKVFYQLLYVSLSLAGFLMAVIIMQNSFTFTKAGYRASSLGVVILLFIPLAIAIKEEYKLNQVSDNDDPRGEASPTKGAIERHETQAQLDALSDNKVDKASGLTNIFKGPNRGEDHTTFQAIFSIDMILLILSVTCALGGALTAIDNMGQIGRALRYSAKSITTFVSLVSIWSYLGRVLGGLGSEVVVAKYKCPRPLMMTLLLLFSCVGYLLIAFAVPHSVYIASVIIGFCYGASTPIAQCITSELFGLKNFSTLFNFIALSIPLGTYICNVTLTGTLYDRVALKQLTAKGLTRNPGQGLSCVGPECYRVAFFIITGITLFGSFISLILVFRTRKFYRGDIYKKFRE